MSRLDRLTRLRSAAPVVLPSMLLCDFANLQREVQSLEAAGAEALHLDVMDGVFVPNFTYGMPIVKAFRGLTELPLDVHLMIRHPEKYLEAFAEAGADLLTFHIEAVGEPGELLRRIKAADVAAGVVLNPQTPLAQIEGCLAECDLVLIMSVEAGFGGQSFQPIALDKIRQLRRQAGDDLLIEVDGGINQETIAACAEAGADLFVVGSGIFAADDYAAAIHTLTTLAQ